MSTSSVVPVPATSVPPIQFTEAGLIIPPAIDVLAGVQIDINYAFGGGVNPALETPQGQLASSEAAVVVDKNSQIAYICTQIDPQYATGRFQDAIGRIYFLTRKPATSTVVTCNVSGLPSTPIPAGTLAQDTLNNTYVLLDSVTIDASGTVTSSWANLQTGPIPCAANTLTKVYQAIPGWDTITNPTEGALGQNVESPSEFEFRRRNSVALNSQGTPPAIYARVFDVDNVLDCYVIDNPAGTDVIVGPTSFTLAHNSVYVCALGGIDASVASAIWGKKNTGCSYNGNVTVNITDDTYSYPPPTYAVKFQRPTPLPIKFAVQIVNNPALPSNTVDSIKTAIIARFNGTDSTQRERIAGTVIAARYYNAVAINNQVIPLSILVGTTTANQTSVALGIDQNPTLDPNDITVTFV